MEIVVQRRTYTAFSTQGEMMLDGEHFAWTLEPRRDRSRGKPYCVPAGTYPVTLEPSQHFGFPVPVVNNVPGFTAVEIHPGNYPGNTHACCLVGETQGADFVGQSRAAFDALMLRLNQTEISITYKENQ